MLIIVSAAVGNFNWKDWATFAGTSAACYPFGWAVGQFPLAAVCAGSSVYACMLFAFHRRWSESTETVSYHGSHDWRIRWFHASVSAVFR